MPYFVDAHDQATGTKLAAGPITTVSRYTQTRRVNQSGTWGADLVATEARINHTDPTPADRVLDAKRLVRCHGVRGAGTVEFGAGIIDSLGIVAADYGMDIGGNDLLVLLDNPTVHTLSLSSGGSAISVKAAVDAVVAYGGGWGLSFDTTTYLSVGDTTNTNTAIANVTNISNFAVGDPIFGAGIPANTFVASVTPATDSIGLSIAATATATGVHLHTNQVLLQLAGESVLAALNRVAELVGESYRRDGDAVVWLYRTRESCGLRAVAAVDPIAILSNDTVVVITGLTYQRDSRHIYTRIFPYGAGSGSARETIAGVTTPLPDGFSYGTTTIGSANYFFIQHDDSVAASGAIERNVPFQDIDSPTVLAAAALIELQRNLTPLDTYRVTLEKVVADIKPGQTLFTEYHDAVDGYRPLDILDDLYVLEAQVELTVDGSALVGLLLSNQRRWPLTTKGRLKQLATDVQTLSMHGQPTTEAQTIPDNAVTQAKLADNSVGTAELIDANVTPIKLSTITYLLNADVAAATVVNTTTETPVYSFSVPAGTLGTSNKLRLKLDGSLLNNTGGTQPLQVRVKYGTTTCIDITTTALGASATARPLLLSCDLAATGAATTQAAAATLHIGGATGIVGVVGQIGSFYPAAHESIAEDSSGALNMVVSVQFAVADAALSFTAKTCYVEVVR